MGTFVVDGVVPEGEFDVGGEGCRRFRIKSGMTGRLRVEPGMTRSRIKFRMTSRINITEEGVDYSGEGAAGTRGGGNEGVSVAVSSCGVDGLEGEFFAGGAGC